MISANKIAKWIRQNGSPPATLPAKELCEGPHEATEVFWECTFRASDHCQQMREREMPIICKFTATSFQRGLESQRTARSSAQVQTWVGRGLVDRGKEGKKGTEGNVAEWWHRDSEAWGSQGTESLPQAFPGGSTTLWVRPPLPVRVRFYNMFSNHGTYRASKWPCPGAKSNTET